MWSMSGDRAIQVRLPSSVVALLDARAADEFRSRAGTAAMLIVQGLAEQADTNEAKEQA